MDFRGDLMATMTREEIRMKGIDALRKALKPSEFLRFFQEYEKGNGDYTRDRGKILGLEGETVDSLAEKIHKSHPER